MRTTLEKIRGDVKIKPLNVHNFIAELKSHRYSYENVFVFVVIGTFLIYYCMAS